MHPTSRSSARRMAQAAPELCAAAEAALEWLAPYDTSEDELEAADRLRRALATAKGDPIPVQGEVNPIIPLWAGGAP